MAKKRREKRRGDTWVGRRPVIYKDRKKEQNRQGEARLPKHKKRYSEEGKGRTVARPRENGGRTVARPRENGGRAEALSRVRKENAIC